MLAVSGKLQTGQIAADFLGYITNVPGAELSKLPVDELLIQTMPKVLPSGGDGADSVVSLDSDKILPAASLDTALLAWGNPQQPVALANPGGPGLAGLESE